MRIYFKDVVSWEQINDAVNDANDQADEKKPGVLRSTNRVSFKLGWDHVMQRLYVDALYIKDPTDIRTVDLPASLVELGSKFSCVLAVAGEGSLRAVGKFIYAEDKWQIKGVPEGGGMAQEWYMESTSYEGLVNLIWKLRSGEVGSLKGVGGGVVLTGLDKMLLLHAYLHRAQVFMLIGERDEVGEKVPNFVIEQLDRAHSLLSEWNVRDFAGARSAKLPCCASIAGFGESHSDVEKMKNRLYESYPLETKVQFVLALALSALNMWILHDRGDQPAETVLEWYVRALDGLSEDGLDM